MEFVVSFDMRAPAFGAPAKELYAAALDICAWADELGFDVIGLGEHHASEDGYLPSPIPLAGAIAGRRASCSRSSARSWGVSTSYQGGSRCTLCCAAAAWTSVSRSVWDVDQRTCSKTSGTRSRAATR